jgi:hypothetical protein
MGRIPVINRSLQAFHLAGRVALPKDQFNCLLGLSRSFGLGRFGGLARFSGRSRLRGRLDYNARRKHHYYD